MKRKNLLKLIIGVSLVTVMAISIPLMSGCAPKAAPGEPTPEPAEELPTFKWRFQSYCQAPLTDSLFRPTLEALERASGGRLEIEIYLSDELVPTSELIPALQRGTLDITCSTDEFMAAPIGDLAKISGCLPFAVDNGLEVDVLWHRKGLDEIWEEAYDEIDGVTYLSMGSYDPTNFITSKPIHSWEDLQGLKVQSLGCLAGVIEKAGVVSMTLPWEDIMMGIQTGVLDGICWCGATEGYTCGWVDVAKYFLTNPICGGWALDWVVRTESWEALPPDLQELWWLALDSYNYNKTEWYYWGESHYRTEGEEFILTTLPPEDFTKFEAYKDELYDELAASSPQCARAIQIIRDYQAELKASGYPYR